MNSSTCAAVCSSTCRAMVRSDTACRWSASSRSHRWCQKTGQPVRNDLVIARPVLLGVLPDGAGGDEYPVGGDVGCQHGAVGVVDASALCRHRRLGGELTEHLVLVLLVPAGLQNQGCGRAGIRMRQSSRTTGSRRGAGYESTGCSTASGGAARFALPARRRAAACVRVCSRRSWGSPLLFNRICDGAGNAPKARAAPTSSGSNGTTRAARR